MKATEKTEIDKMDKQKQIQIVSKKQSIAKRLATIYNNYIQFNADYAKINTAATQSMITQSLKEQYILFAKKHLDYGMSNISAGTQLANDEEKQFALTGLWYRLSDKVNRWKNIIITKQQTKNEALTDTYPDITNYGIIAQLVEKGMWKK